MLIQLTNRLSVATPAAEVSGGTEVSMAISLTGAGRIGFYRDYSELTAAGTHKFYVCRTHGTAGAVSVDYATSGATHTTASGTLSWADGQADIKSFTVEITAGNLTTHDAAGLGEHRIVALLSNPVGGVALHRGSSATRAYGVVDNATMIASDANAVFIDFDAVTNGSGTAASPYNHWTAARENLGSKKIIYGKGTAVPGLNVNDVDVFGGGQISVFDNKLDASGIIEGTSDTNRLHIRNWPGSTWTVTGVGASSENLTSGFIVEPGDYITFKGINFTTLDSSGRGSAPNQCFGVWFNGSSLMSTVEHCVLNGIKSGANSGTGAVYCDGPVTGFNLYRTSFQNVEKATATNLPNAIEFYDGGYNSVTECNIASGIIHVKDSPTISDSGTVVRFCITNEVTRFKVVSANDSSSNDIFQGNLARVGGLFTNSPDDGNAVYLGDNGAATGTRPWIVGNVFDDVGNNTADGYPIYCHQDHDEYIIFNNIFYLGHGFVRVDTGAALFFNNNHEQNVGPTNSTNRYNYLNTSYASTAAFTAANSSFQNDTSSGDPDFTNLAGNNVALGASSTCDNTGVDGTPCGVDLVGFEAALLASL